MAFVARKRIFCYHKCLQAIVADHYKIVLKAWGITPCQS